MHAIVGAAAHAFDSIAPGFDDRFGAWASVAAQRGAVRAELVRAFAPGARVIEIGGGTGEDAAWLTRQGRHVLLTDPSPTMVGIAVTKLGPLGAPAPLVLPAEGLGALPPNVVREPLDGAFSNFAALNCVTDIAPVAHALARLVRPGGRALLVLFGTCAPGEWIVELMRGRPRAAVRRFARGDVTARIGGRPFAVRYHRVAALRRAFAPWFTLRARRGIGVFVPPSAAEPWISAHPALLRALVAVDRVASRPLAALGDHVLYDFERTSVAAQGPS
jgi:SAM-dependent methyltransferase